MAEEERSGGFLPPEPAGPEPELGSRPAAAAGAGASPPSGAASQAPPPGYGGAWGGGPQAPPPGYGQGHPPASTGWQPPQGQQPQQPQQAQWGAQPWRWQEQAPDNNPAVAGFVLSLVAAGLLLISGGISSILSVGCAIAGIVYSRKGRQRVDSGASPKHRGLAQAGFIIGIVALVLSLLATAFWTVIVVLAVTDDEFQNDLERELDQSDSIRAAARLTLAAARLGLHLLA